MSTNLEIIEDALRDINVIAETDSATAEQGSYALRKLNQLMGLWKLSDIDLGYFEQTSTSADCPIPDWSEGAVIASLAVILAPKYGASVSPELAAVADAAVNVVARTLINDKLTNTDMSHLPTGEGIGSRYDIETDG